MSRGYMIGFWITWVPVFLACWLGAMLAYGFLLGGIVGAVAAALAATIAAALWPITVLVVVAGAVVLFR